MSHGRGAQAKAECALASKVALSGAKLSRARAWPSRACVYLALGLLSSKNLGVFRASPLKHSGNRFRVWLMQKGSREKASAEKASSGEKASAEKA